MANKYLKNSIISFALIVSVILTPLAFIPIKANAQGITGYISGSSATIAQLPLCQDKAATALSHLFSASDFLKNLAIETATKLAEEEITKLAEEASSNLFISNSIPIYIGKKSTDDIAQIKKDSADTKKIVESTNVNDTCLKSIGRVVIKMLLQKMTLSTVEWINNGYNGSPMFIQNPGDFFKDIAKNEILQFNLEISDLDLFPFGKAWMQNQAIAFNQKFANNAQYSLNELIKQTNPEFSDQTFRKDFSKGGWSAWNALTQVPANNPLGFSMMASNELQQRLAGTNQSNAQNLRDSLREAGGYLGSERCVNPSMDITRAEHNDALNKVAGARLCTRWEYVTPGQMVAVAATSAMKYPENNLLKAEDLNDAVATILDAMLSKFSTDIMGKSGFAGLSDSTYFQQASEGKFIIDTENTEIYDSFQDFPGYQVAGSSFLSQNPSFNIRTDLNQAVIDEQRIFLDKIKEQNKELKSTTDGKPYEINKTTGLSNAYGIIPTIYQLDYCIPGPHPGFKTDSRNVLNAVLDTIVPETEESLSNRTMAEIMAGVKIVIGVGAAAAGAAIGASIGSAFPVVGTIIGAGVGALVGWIVSLVGGRNDEKNLRGYYAMMYGFITGLNVDWGEKPSKDNPAANNLYSKQNLAQTLNMVLDRYFILIDELYKPELMPSATKEAATKFGQQKGYAQMYKNNEDKIVSMKSVIVRLGEIKNKIDILNNELAKQTIKDKNGNKAPLDDQKDSSGNITKLGQQSQYEENLKPWISAFGRLSAEMVNGDDIAVVNNRIKQIVDEKDYIYNILLKGPTGCEKEIELNKGAGGGLGLHQRVADTKRMDYPGELLYDYNYYTSSASLPDPYKSNYKNKMPENGINVPKEYVGKYVGKINGVGPGFLSWANFSDNNHACSYFENEQKPKGEWIGCLDTLDIIPTDKNSGITPLGFRPNANASGGSGIFEGMIGVY